MRESIVCDRWRHFNPYPALAKYYSVVSRCTVLH